MVPSSLLTMILALFLSLSAVSRSMAEADLSGSGSNEKESLLALLPKKEEIPEIKESSVPEFYGPQNLFDYINGEAETYLDYGFNLLLTREYLDKEGSIITIEIYRMKSPLHGFGIYAAERTPDDKVVDIGTQGIQGGNIVAFWKGGYYCKILFHRMSPGLDSVLLKTARLIAGKIEGDYSLPELFSVFPEKHRVKGSERFIPRNFQGQPYLRNGYRVDYEREGKRFQVFLVHPGSMEAAKETYLKYQEFLRTEHANPSRIESGEYEMARVPGEQEKLLFRYGTFWGGVLGEKDFSAAERIVQKMVEKLKPRN
ncbi:MAG: hypothetical protein CVU57_15455 [Deltaproteobacteria bacterium HGW-Deltaproteobacteria-15]|nr:MAG: hypothetical protein CVU57_15455 [Deltaproteobacteria bacterium HGW-Deltaproteobacteria-15]